MKYWNIGWGLTSKCNSRCQHCYNESSNDLKENEINYEQAIQIVDKLSLNKVQTINYGTGESGLVDYFWDLVQYVHSKGIVQGLTTNGSSVTKQTIGYIKKYIADVDISIDYPTSESNNEFRGSKNAWQWATNACMLLKENNINFSIVTCLHSMNATPQIINDFLNICRAYDCEWRINWFRPTGRGRNADKLKLNPVTVHKVFKYIVENSVILALPDPYFSAIIGLNIRNTCPCGNESFRITTNAEVVPCVYFTKEMVSKSLLINSFNEVINSDIMQAAKNRKPRFCLDCEYFSFCNGGCMSRAYLEYHSLDAPDAFCYKSIGMKQNPLLNLKYKYQSIKPKVHQNYLCTLIVKPL